MMRLFKRKFQVKLDFNQNLVTLLQKKIWTAVLLSEPTKLEPWSKEHNVLDLDWTAYWNLGGRLTFIALRVKLIPVYILAFGTHFGQN